MPGTPTTKYAIPTIAGADLISGIDDWSVAAMGAIDPLLAPSDQGTLASRPVSTIPSPSGKAGRTYYATDTKQLFRDTGTAWIEIVLAGTTPPAVGVPAQQAWQTVALTGSAGVWAPTTISYMKDSLGFVHFRGDVSFSSGTVAAGATVFTLPVGYRPVTTVAVASLRCFPSATFSGTGLTISAAGVVSHSNGLTAGEGLSMGGVSFLAEN